MKKTFFATIFLCTILFCHAAAPASWYSTPRAAQAAAKEKGLPILIVFAGGNWCYNSTEFRAKIAENGEFMRLINTHCIPLFVELPPAASWSKSFQAQLLEQYPFLPLANGVPLPALYFTDSNFNNLDIPEPRQTIAGFRKALAQSKIKLADFRPAEKTETDIQPESKTGKVEVAKTKVTKSKITKKQVDKAENEIPGYTSGDQMKEAQSQRASNRNPKADPPAGWFIDPNKAKEFAAKRKLPILVLFSGTDWCPPCRALRAKVLDKSNVRKLVTEKCVALYVHVASDSWLQVRQQYSFWTGRGVPSFVLTDANFKVIRGVNVRQRSYNGIKEALDAAFKRLK